MLVVAGTIKKLWTREGDRSETEVFSLALVTSDLVWIHDHTFVDYREALDFKAKVSASFYERQVPLNMDHWVVLPNPREWSAGADTLKEVRERLRQLEDLAAEEACMQ